MKKIHYTVKAQRARMAWKSLKEQARTKSNKDNDNVVGNSTENNDSENTENEKHKGEYDFAG